jgi:hypothetical protein
VTLQPPGNSRGFLPVVARSCLASACRPTLLHNLQINRWVRCECSYLGAGP